MISGAASASIPASPFGYSWQEDMINEGDFDATAVFADKIWTPPTA